MKNVVDENGNIIENVSLSNSDTIEDLKKMVPTTREHKILEISALETLTPGEEGVELNEGYSFNVDGAIPQIADGIAKMALEMDNQPDFGENGGAAFIALINSFYDKLKAGE